MKSSSSKSTKSNSSEPSVMFFRLNNGEDIISEVQETDFSYILLNPCKVMYLTSAKPGYLSISFMQWVFSRIVEEQTFEIAKKEVLFSVAPSTSMAAQYWNSVEHFMNMENKQKIEFDNIVSDDEEFTQSEAEDALEMLKDFFKKNDRGKLH